MKEKQKLIESAKKKLNKAERYYEIENFNKAAKNFIKAGEDFYKAEKYDIAEKSFSMASKSYEDSKNYEYMSECCRKAANACLMVYDFNNAKRNFQLAAKYALRKDKGKYRNFDALVCGSLSYLCLFLLGRQNEGLKYLKSIKVKVDLNSFKDHILTQLIKNITTAIRDRNDESLKEVENNLETYNLSSAEVRLIKFILHLAYVNILIETELNFQKSDFTTDEKIPILFLDQL